MKRLTIRAALSVLGALAIASSATAQDFSANSEARSWNLGGEQKARFEAKVVDVLCELTGDCPAACGEGKRQMGLVRSADDVLVLVTKNSQPAFSGAAEELAPFCGQTVEVDGLLIDQVDPTVKNIYQIQKIRKAGDAEWTKANSWTKKWAEAHPEAKGKGPWFRRDPRINGLIEENGYLGLGLEVDKVFLEDWF